jgi:hypothetical protein
MDSNAIVGPEAVERLACAFMAPPELGTLAQPASPNATVSNSAAWIRRGLARSVVRAENRIGRPDFRPFAASGAGQVERYR